MTNPSATNSQTQLNRVFSAMKDGVWRSLSEISAITGDDPYSIASRLRDLRLPAFGNHQVDIRKRALNTCQDLNTWEYRLNSQPNFGQPTPTISSNSARPASATRAWSGSGNSSTTTSPNNSTQSVKFLNVNTLQPEYVPKASCKIDQSDGFNRVVALDSNGKIIKHLITTQCDL